MLRYNGVRCLPWCPESPWPCPKSPRKPSGTFVALTGTLIIIQPSMTCPFLPRSLR